MNEDIVKKTQDSLGKIIGKKPPLTEKLLNRPPFRFLHDIITSVIRQTGFMKGLFTEKEASAENISSKEDKVLFLQKAIDITAYVSGTKLSARPSKIVAGVEAEKTNDFLQALALAIGKKPDNESCVKKILSGGGGGDSSSRGSRDSKSKDSKEKESKDKESKDKESKDKESKDRDRETSADRRKRRSDKEKSSTKSSSVRKDKENRENNDKRDRDRDGSGRKDRDSRKHRDSSKDGRRESSRHRESSRDRKEKESSDRRDDKRERSGRGHRKHEEETPQINGITNESREPESRPSPESKVDEDTQETHEEPTPHRIPRPASAKGSRRRHREGRRQADDLDDDEGVQPQVEKEKRTMQSSNQEDESIVPPQVEQSRRLARPSSARPAPPRVKRQEGMQDSLNERVDSARTQRVQNVIIDNAAHSEEEDDDNFMVDEGAQEPVMPDREETVAPPSEEDGQHGGLVKKILESKKEYAQSEQTQQSQTRTKIDKSSVNDVTRHKEKEMVRKEVDKLRGSIQTLTRSANPLGKIMDYVQEDIHSMQKETDMWRAENKKLAGQIKQEMGVTDGSIEPLRVTLAELEQAVADQLDLIAAVKHSIIDNDDKITKMLSSVSRT